MKNQILYPVLSESSAKDKETPLLEDELIEKFSSSFANKIFQPEVLFERLNSDWLNYLTVG